MPNPTSVVLAFPPDTPESTANAMAAKLSHHTDAWDLSVDLANGIRELVVIDNRSSAKYLAGHIPGAISLSHRDMTPERLAELTTERVYITYCDGIGCNASTKGAWKLARHGLRVKELLGGLDFWKRDGHPVASGDAPGSLVGDMPDDCGCA